MPEIEPGLLTEDQMTYVTDADGVVQPHKVPKHWIGTDLLPAGYKVTRKTPDAPDDGGEAS